MAFTPTILVDSREQLPLRFSNLPSERATLITGDYSILGATELFAVERKTIADLIGCCMSGRDRFERELHRLRGYRFKRLLIVGTEEEIRAGEYHSRIKPQCVLGSLGAFEVRYDVPIVYSPNAEQGARCVEKWASYFAREVMKVASVLDRETKRESECEHV